MPIKHKFRSGVVDKTNATLVRPSNWNEAHDTSLADITEFRDVPDTLVGHGGELLRANLAENSFEFIPRSALLDYVDLPNFFISTDSPMPNQGIDGDIWIKYIP
jgi:hypothetical protein